MNGYLIYFLQCTYSAISSQIISMNSHFSLVSLLFVHENVCWVSSTMWRFSLFPCLYAVIVMQANLLFYFRTENYVNWPDNNSTVPVPISPLFFYSVLPLSQYKLYAKQCMVISLVSLVLSKLSLESNSIPVPTSRTK